MKILVVDDSLVMRRIIINNLNDLLLKDIVEAEGGLECLEILRKEKIDLLFLDLNIPFLDGFEVLKEIQKIKKLRRLKIIVCSGETKRKDIVKAISLGANDYIVKPFDKRSFRNIFLRHIGKL